MSDLNLQKLLYKIKNCGSYYMLYKLEEGFNSVGFTLQRTLKDHYILCRIVNGEPVTEEPMDDYIFLGSVDESTIEVPNGNMDSIINFIIGSASEAAKLDEGPRINRNGFCIYGRIMLVNEDIHKISQEMSECDYPINEDIDLISQIIE